MLLSVIDLKHAPVFDRCVVGCGSENGHQKNMFLEDIGVRVGIVLTILGSIVNILGGQSYMIN